MSRITLDLADRQALIETLKSVSKNDLHMLNKLIVGHLKSLQLASKAEHMAQFAVGDRVSFEDKQGELTFATILRLNKKTASLLTDDDERWNVAPELLTLENAQERPLPLSDSGPVQSELPGFTDHSDMSTPQIGQAREWIGGLVDVPGVVTGEPGDPYRPLMFIWMNQEGLVLSMSVIKPGDDQAYVIDSLREAIDKPMVGKSGAPSHVRVADEQTARELEENFPSITVIVGPVPELDHLKQAVHTDLPELGQPLTYLSTGIPEPSVRAFFDACANLFRTKPWTIVPEDQCLISVTSKALSLDKAVIIVIGQMAESHGLLLFKSLREHEQYMIGSDAIQREREPDLPQFSVLSFDKPGDIEPAIRKEITQHGWQVANANAYPTLVKPDPDRTQRPLVAEDMTVFEALASSLTQLFSGKTRLQRAWSGAEPVSVSYKVDTHAGPIDIRFDIPYPYAEIPHSGEADDTVMAELMLISRNGEYEKDWDQHNELIEKLNVRYLNSAEFKEVPDGPSAAILIMNFAFSYLDETIATISAGALEYILYELVPAKVMLEPVDSQAIIEDAHAFYRFLKREYALEQADSCLDVLGAHAVTELATALADRSKFGLAKSVLPGGNFDFGEYPGGLPNPTAKTKPKDPKSRKQKRKNSRKARKKNR